MWFRTNVFSFLRTTFLGDGLSFREREVGFAEALQLHLFLSIIMLILVLRFFEVAPALFDTALFSCISMPATYAMAYYHSRLYREGKFVLRKRPSPERVWAYELIALIASYGMGFMVFVALSGVYDYVAFTIAFATVQFMRVAISVVLSHLRAIGVDVQRPAIVLLVSLAMSTITSVLLALAFSALV